MRRLALLLCTLLLWPAAALAADSVQQIVEAAVKALDTTCYEGRMRFLSQFEHGQEQTVHIFHVAPDLYRVTPLVKGKLGNQVYVENAEELVRMETGSEMVVELPQRQFSISDSLTMKFLRDLGTHPGTSVLDGIVGNYSVYVLRQDKLKEKPYTITVGVDKRNYFPLFLLVTDGDDKTRVYYEMEVIEYRKPNEINDSWFVIPDSRSQRIAPASPRPNQSLESTGGSGKTASNATLPMYPQWLPQGYQLEALSLLNYTPAGSSKSSLVYQYEVFGPKLSDIISIFQTQNLALDFGGECNQEDCGYFLLRKDSWLIAVLGGQELQILQRIAESLDRDNAAVSTLLDATTTRDHILRQATSAEHR